MIMQGCRVMKGAGPHPHHSGTWIMKSRSFFTVFILKILFVIEPQAFY